jgi:hypothetical protein
MFGLRYKVEHLASRIAGQEFLRKVDVDTISTLEERVDKLTKALEWHVGTSLKVMNLEEKLIMLRVAEAKKRGDTFGEQGDEVARQVCDGINQSVNQKLDNDVRTDTEQGQDSRE